MDIDDVFADVGEFGRYQKLILWFILLPSAFPCGFHAYNQLFMAANSNHWCKNPDLNNSQHSFVKNISIPLEIKNGQTDFSQCFMYDRNYTNITADEIQTNFSKIYCKHGWTHDRTHYASTVISEWDLVCEDDFLPTLALVLFGASGLVGNFIFGYVQDGLGRKTSFFIYLLIQCIFGVATAFAQNFSSWLIYRIGVGFTIPAILATPYVLAIEMVGPRYRTSVTILINIAYSSALISLAFIVWLIRDWRTLSLYTTIPFIGLFCFWKLLPESPRWLLSRGRFDEAEQILTKIAKSNGKKLPVNYMAQLKRKAEEEMKIMKQTARYGITDLFKSPNLRLKTITITFIWFTNTSVYVGLSYYAPILSGNEFLNFFLAGAVEMPTYFFLGACMERWGRRCTLCVSMIVGGLACLATFSVHYDSSITLMLYCIGKMGISSAFVVLPLTASEIYPTVVRGLGMSISSVVGMLGPTLIPLVNYLGSEIIVLPLIVMGILLVMGGICSLFLPETLNRRLPQTLQDGEDISLNHFKCRFSINT